MIIYCICYPRCFAFAGYDHIDDQMADEMEALEIALLGQMKIANPYLDDELALGTREAG